MYSTVTCESIHLKIWVIKTTCSLPIFDFLSCGIPVVSKVSSYSPPCQIFIEPISPLAALWIISGRSPSSRNPKDTSKRKGNIYVYWKWLTLPLLSSLLGPRQQIYHAPLLYFRTLIFVFLLSVEQIYIMRRNQWEDIKKVWTSSNIIHPVRL